MEEIKKDKVEATERPQEVGQESLKSKKDEEFEQFKVSVKNGASGFMSKTFSLFKRAGGAVAEVGWKSLFTSKKGVEKVAEGAQAAGTAVVEGGREVGSAAAEIYEFTKDVTVDVAKRTGKATAEGAQEIGKATVEVVKDAAHVAQTGAEFVVGAGALAAEKTFEVGQVAVAKGQELIYAGKERAAELIEATKERAIDAKNKVGSAVESAKDAAVAKTMEGVENAKMAVRSGIEATTNYGASVYEKAQGRMTSAWEAMKQKVNDIKRAAIERKLAQAESKASQKLEEANKLRGILSQLSGARA